MRTIIVTKGLPACGKSTFAKDLLKKEPKRWKRVNRDDLRALLDDSTWSTRNEDFVKLVQEKIVRCALKDGFDVIMDNTHLVPTTLRKIHTMAESIGDVKVIEKAFNVDVEECVRRNALRTGTAKVPEKVIRDMARGAGLDRGRTLTDKETYYVPKIFSETYEQDASLPKAIICDLDGTLAHMGNRSPYDASTCDQDGPNWPVINCVLAMYAKGYKVIFMSGREDKYREPTIRFIEQYVRTPNNWAFSQTPETRPTTSPIPYELHMRTTGDQRKDNIIKRELFEQAIVGKYYVEFCLDDRNQVVDGWREMGLSCFQVQPGDF